MAKSYFVATLAAMLRPALLPVFLGTLWFAVGCSKASSSPEQKNGQANLPERVIVLGPSSAETLFSMGLGDKVVGVSDYCVWPEAKNLPRLGGQINPNRERITALQPDLIITQGEFPDLERFLRDQGIATLPFKTDTWSEWRSEVRSIGQYFHCPERAQQLLVAKEQDLETVRLRMRDVLGSSPSLVPTLLVVGRFSEEATGMTVAGGGSFLNEMLSLAGGRNVFAANPRDYFDLSEEEVIAAAPHVILELKPGADADKDDILELWQTSFPGVPAVKNRRVHLLTEDYILLPGPRMPEIANLFQNYVLPNLEDEKASQE